MDKTRETGRITDQRKTPVVALASPESVTAQRALTTTDSATSAVQLWAFPSGSVFRNTLLRPREVRLVTVAA
jgi:hypothetical protein